MSNQQDVINEIIQHGINRLERVNEGSEVSEIHYTLYNEDYFIIGTYAAEQFLETSGVFRAIKKIQAYEQENFGQVTTDLGNPEHIANMLSYIIGEEVLQECECVAEHWNQAVTPELLETLKVEMEDKLV